MKSLLRAAGLLVLGVAPALAASEADFKAAYAAAAAAESEAAGLRNRWTATEAALAAARRAAEQGNFDAAIASAHEALALAKASVFQAASEKERWRDMVIR